MGHQEQHHRQLVEKVNRLEVDKTDETSPEDWSNRIEAAIQRGEQNIIKTVASFRNYIPNPDKYLDARLKDYHHEIVRIKKQLSFGDGPLQIEELVNDIGDGSEQEETTRLLLKLAEQEPVKVLNAHDYFKDWSSLEKILETATKALANSSDPALVFDFYPILKTYSFFESELVSASERVLKEDPEHFLLFCDSALGVAPHFLELPQIQSKLGSLAYDCSRLYHEVAFRYDRLFRTLPDSDRYLKILLDQSAKLNPKLLMANVKVWESRVSDLPYWVEKIVLQISKDFNNTDITLDILAHFSGVEFPDRERILEETLRWAVISRPDKVVGYKALFEKYAFGKELFDIAAKRRIVLDALMTDKHRVQNQGFMGDLALRDVHLIERSWLPTLSDQDFGATASYLCRSLYFKDKSVNEKNIGEEYKAWSALREKYAEVPLFSNRDVLLLSHNEQYADDLDRFGKPDFRDALQRQQGMDHEFQHYEAKEPTRDSLEEVKKNTLETLVRLSSPMTFYFDGHGGPSELFLSDGRPVGLPDELNPERNQEFERGENTVTINCQELARALKSREDRLGIGALSKDLLVIDACFNHDFIRNLYKELQTLHCSLPAAIGPSEFGQYGFSDRTNRYGNRFKEDVLQVGSDRSRFQDIWENEGDTNPSLFVPSLTDSLLPAQIARSEIEGSVEVRT